MRKHVVILGGGFGGLHAARALRGAPVDITLVDRANHHVFQPLLYQVALAQLAPSDIAAPIRWMLRRQWNCTVLLGEATAIDAERRVVVLDGGATTLAYDYLVVATGARHSYFGHDEWEAFAPGLKNVDDAEEIRRRFLLAFEEAERNPDPAEVEANTTFVIVGGGPTGVELAGMIPDVARLGMRADFRRIDTRQTRVILLEAGPRILPAYPEHLSAWAQQALEELGVVVRTGAMVTRVEGDAVYVGEERIPTHAVYWAAGNEASPIGGSLGAELDKAGRVHVSPDLSVLAHREIFVVGDLALAKLPDGSPVPAVAPAAMQMGRLAGRNIRRDLRGEPRRGFRYRNKGNLATIGRHRAIADFGRLRLTGYIAWWFWLFVHILYLVGFRNRISVLIQWAYAYITHQRGVRLITGTRGRAGARAPVEPRW